MRIFKRKGSPNWWAQWYDQNGQRHRKSTGTSDKSLAQGLVAKWQQESFLERHFDVIPETPFRDALLRYGEVCQNRNPVDYHNRVRLDLQRLLNEFGHLHLTDLTTARLQDYASKRLKTVKEATVLRNMAVIFGQS